MKPAFALFVFSFGLLAQPSANQSAARPSVVTRSVEDRLADHGTDVKDFGAKCDGGRTDDRQAIQSAIDAAAGGEVFFPDGSTCGVSAPGLFLYPANAGILLRGQGGIPVKAPGPGKGSGIIAYAAEPPVALLTNMAEGSHLVNLDLDCNGGAATNALINVATDWAIETNLVASHCGGDGMLVFNEGTPATTLSADVSAGARSLPVASITNNRITFGKDFCTYLVIDYGNPGAEDLTIAGPISGTSIPVTPTVHPHSAGASVRCHGNANDMHIDHYYSFNSGLKKKAGEGWGFRIIPGEDNNAIWWANHNSNSNFSGGELWFGSVQKHYGGDYQGDAGPAIQLGSVTGNDNKTHFMSVFPVGDMEEDSPAYNVISLVCDDSSQINATVENSVVFETGSKACPAYPRGSSSSAYGTFINGVGPGFWTHTGNGYVETFPGNPGTIRFFDSAHKLLLSVPSNMALQLGPGSVTATGGLISYRGLNSTTDVAGPGCGNNAVCATVADSSGSTSWPQGAGVHVSVRLTNYSLRAGANTLTLNGVTRAICSHFNPANPIGIPYALGGVFNATLSGKGCWADDSQ